MKELLTKMQNCYRGHLYKAYILNSPSAFSVLWNIAKLCMEEYTISKISVEKETTCPALWTHINPEQLEEKYGGKAPNKKDNFWPPFMASQNYFLPSEDPQKILVSKDLYKKMHQAKMLEGSKVWAEFLL
jgi:CRAL/TRIO domain